MLCYKDKTFCVSPDCKNECGRKLTDKDRRGAEGLKLPLSVGHFCGGLHDDYLRCNLCGYRSVKPEEHYAKGCIDCMGKKE